MALTNGKDSANQPGFVKSFNFFQPERRHFLIGVSLGLTLLALFLIYGLPLAKADTRFTVTNTNDTGPGSLRQAILNFNALASGYNYIDFDAGIEGAIISLQSPLPTITGSGGFNDTRNTSLTPHRVKIDGRGLYRLFSVTGPTVRFYNLDMVNGYAAQNSPNGALGGAIYYGPNSHTDIALCNFSNNHVASNVNGGLAAGGAIYLGNDPFGLVSSSTFTNNSATATGGAIAQGGAFWTTGVDFVYKITQSQFNQNYATAENTSAAGGAVYVSNSTEFDIYSNSSFTGNYASGTTNSPNTFSTGGALAVISSTVSVYQTSFTGNIAAKTATDQNASAGGSSSEGGAIYAGNNVQLTVGPNTLLQNNQAKFGEGGGLANNGPVVITETYFSGNNAYLDGGGLITSGATADIRRSTFSANTTNATTGLEGSGAAIYNLSDMLTLANCTITGNTASEFGGALFNGGGNVKIYNSTITLNSAAKGGGLAAVTNNVYLQNTILAENTAPATFGPNFYDLYSSSFTSGGNNLIDNTGSTNVTLAPVAGDKFNAASQPLNLGPLQDNGGATPTRHPLPGSQALDAGSNSGCANSYVGNLDQRGIGRPYAGTCDIGAVEVIQFIVTNPGDQKDQSDDGQCRTAGGFCTLRAALEQPFIPGVPVWINFHISSGGLRIQPATSLPVITHPVYIDPTFQFGDSCGSSYIELDGSLLPTGQVVAGLTLGAGSANSKIRGLAINRFSGPALEVASTNNALACSQLGIRVNSGDTAGTNAGGAVLIKSGGQLALDATDNIGGKVRVQGGNLKILNHVVINLNTN